MARVRAKRRGIVLTDPQLAALLHGQMYPPGGGRKWPDGSSWVTGVELLCPAGRRPLRQLWLDHRDHVLELWKATGKRGRCYAQRTFGMQGERYGNEPLPRKVDGDDGV